MKRKILILALASFIFVSFNFIQAQDDPGVPDTVWIIGVPMAETWDPFMLRAFPFTVKCSIFTDEYLSTFDIPISFYHSQNLDILAVDTLVWSSWVTDVGGGLEGDTAINDSVTIVGSKSPKHLRGAYIWWTDSLPPGRGVLFTVYFNQDYSQVPDWDISKSIILDTAEIHPPALPNRAYLDFSTVEATSFTPIFHYGVIGDTVVISGTAFKDDGSTPDAGVSVYCRGKEVYGSYFPGRVLTDKTDGSGNFRFVVGKGGYWCVFRDTSGAMVPGTNAFCFDPLLSDTSGLIFKGYTDVEEEKEKDVIIPEKFVLFQNYPNPFNPNTVIEFALPKDCWVKVEVFNLLGQKVRTLADKSMKKGIKKVIWNGKNEKGAEVSSGIYFYRIKTDEFTGVKKMILVK